MSFELGVPTEVRRRPCGMAQGILPQAVMEFDVLALKAYRANRLAREAFRRCTEVLQSWSTRNRPGMTPPWHGSGLPGPPAIPAGDVATALPPNGHARGMGRAEIPMESGVGGKGRRMEFGVSPRQVEPRHAFWKPIAQGREGHPPDAQALQAVEGVGIGQS